jgi:hypothetical protein
VSGYTRAALKHAQATGNIAATFLKLPFEAALRGPGKQTCRHLVLLKEASAGSTWFTEQLNVPGGRAGAARLDAPPHAPSPVAQ